MPDTKYFTEADPRRRYVSEHIGFRFATPPDITTLGTLYIQLIPDAAPDTEEMAAALERMVSDSTNRVIVAELDGAVVGTCQIIVYENLVRAPRRKAVIDSVVVGAEHRGLGIGKAMMRWVIEYLGHENCSHIGIASRFSRTVAQKMYEELRFDQFGYYYLYRTT